MRSAGYFNLDDVYYGLYEANGSFSALAKDEMTHTLPIVIIDGGKVDKKNMGICGIDREYLEKFVRAQGTKIKNVLVMTVDGNGRVYFQENKKPYKILKCEVRGGW